MDKNKTPSTASNSLYSFIAFVWPVALAFFSAPFIVHALGTEQYGIYALMLSAVAFLAFLDFGITPALVRSVAHLMAERAYSRLNHIFSSAFLLYLISGTVGAVILFIFARTWALSFITVSPQNQYLVVTVFTIAAAGFFINTVLTGLAAIPGSIQRFDITSKVNLVTSTITTGGVVLAVALGANVVAAAVIGVAVSLLAVIMYSIINHRLIPELKLKPSLINRKSLIVVLSFGSVATLGILANTALLELDKLLLGGMIGASAVTYYVLPGTLAIKLYLVIATTFNVLFPLTTTLFAKGHHERIRKLYQQSTQAILLIVACVVPALLLNSDVFLLHWLGQEFAQKSTFVLQTLLITYGIMSITIPSLYMAMASGRPSIGAAYSIVSAGLNIGLLLLLVPKYGINGAALAYLLAIIPSALAVIIFTQRKVIKSPLRDLAVPFLRFCGVALSSLLLGVVVHLLSNSLLTFMLYYGLAVLGAGIIAFLTLPRDSRAQLVGRLPLAISRYFR